MELGPGKPPAEPVVVMTAKFVDSESNVVEYGVDLGGHVYVGHRIGNQSVTAADER